MAIFSPFPESLWGSLQPSAVYWLQEPLSAVPWLQEHMSCFKICWCSGAVSWNVLFVTGQDPSKPLCSPLKWQEDSSV